MFFKHASVKKDWLNTTLSLNTAYNEYKFPFRTCSTDWIQSSQSAVWKQHFDEWLILSNVLIDWLIYWQEWLTNTIIYYQRWIMVQVRCHAVYAKVPIFTRNTVYTSSMSSSSLHELHFLSIIHSSSSIHTWLYNGCVLRFVNMCYTFVCST